MAGKSTSLIQGLKNKSSLSGKQKYLCQHKFLCGIKSWLGALHKYDFKEEPV